MFALALTAALVFYLWRLDRAVVRRFENQRFTIPSAVYSAPIELRPGHPLSKADLLRLLTELDYVPGGGSSLQPGEYRLLGKNRIVVRTHEFQTAGGRTEPSHVVAVDVGPQSILSIADLADKRSLSALKLEPLLLGRFYGGLLQTRELVAYEDIRERLVPALLAAEDARFFHHHGIDVWGLVRAVLVNLWHGGVRQGGSTITQQLVKNLWLTPERTMRRKLNEMAMAVLLERHYPKAAILETYANVIYLGRRGSVSILGVGEAARYYFGKPVRELTWGEAATLAGMIRSPALYNPFTHPERAKGRRNDVLAQMVRLGLLDVSIANGARNERLRSLPPQSAVRRAPYFLDYVSTLLRTSHDEAELQSEGLRIMTTIQAPLQLAAERAVRNGLTYLEQSDRRLKGRLQAALISLDAHTGRILAYVGGRDYQTSQFDRVSQARRQIGSLVKPFVFYPALAKGYATTSTWSNEPLVLSRGNGLWSPENYSRESGGQVSLREAIEQSLNLPTVRIALEVGLSAVQTTLASAGLNGEIPLVPAMALGALEASPLEMAEAFATLAALGVHSEPRAIELVTDTAWKPLRRFKSRQDEALDAAPVYILNQLLIGVVQHGTGREALRVGYAGDLAGKTGTTSDYRDAWFAGYTPDIVTVVWVGSDDNQPLHHPGAKLALPIWGEYMLTAAHWWPATQFAQPPGVEWVEIDPVTGQRAVENCPDHRREVFLQGRAPESYCSLHGSFVDKVLDLFR